MSRLIRELEARMGDRIVRGSAVDSIEPDGSGWRVDGRSTDVVVLATPAFVTAGLLDAVAPESSRIAGSIEYAGVTLVTFAFPRSNSVELDGSGFLVPKPDGRLLTACSWASTKWSHLAGNDQVIVRASTGHFGNEQSLELDETTLVDRMLDEIHESTGTRGEPSEVRVSRWPRAFPQYTTGHFERIDALEAALHREAPGIVVTGAAYRGIGIPACIGAATRVAAQLIA